MGGGLYLVLDDAAAVDDRSARGTAAGGTAVIAPEDTECEWSFGTYDPGHAW